MDYATNVQNPNPGLQGLVSGIQFNNMLENIPKNNNLADIARQKNQLELDQLVASQPGLLDQIKAKNALYGADASPEAIDQAVKAQAASREATLYKNRLAASQASDSLIRQPIEAQNSYTKALIESQDITDGQLKKAIPMLQIAAEVSKNLPPDVAKQAIAQILTDHQIGQDHPFFKGIASSSNPSETVKTLFDAFSSAYETRQEKAAQIAANAKKAVEAVKQEGANKRAAMKGSGVSVKTPKAPTTIDAAMIEQIKKLPEEQQAAALANYATQVMQNKATAGKPDARGQMTPVVPITPPQNSGGALPTLSVSDKRAALRELLK